MRGAGGNSCPYRDPFFLRFKGSSRLLRQRSLMLAVAFFMDVDIAAIVIAVSILFFIPLLPDVIGRMTVAAILPAGIQIAMLRTIAWRIFVVVPAVLHKIHALTTGIVFGAVL